MSSGELSKERTKAASQKVKERDYWLNKLSGEWQKTTFYYDHPEAKGTRTMESISFQVTGESFSDLLRLSNHSDQRLFMILLAQLTALLYKYTGQTDIILGAPIYRQEVEGTFINTVLTLRNSFEPGITFKQLLLLVRQTLADAAEHQNYPIEALLHKLNLPVSEDFPLFDITILLENVHKKEYLDHIHTNLSFCFQRNEQSLDGVVEYNSVRYRAAAVQGIIDHYRCLAKQIAALLDTRLTDIDILPEEEKKKILVDFNDTQGEYPEGKTIHQWFAEQAAKTPDAIAISVGQVGEVRRVGQVGQVGLSYRKLNEQSGRLAGVLSRKGVGADVIVALMVERSPEMIIALLAILKAGGAYLPIDTGYPEERKRYMLTDSRVRSMLVDRHNRAPGCAPAGVDIIDVTDPAVYCGDGHNPPQHSGSAGDLVYLIYTSGSTGNPKGVMLEHRNVVNLIYFDFHYTNMDFSKVLQFHTIGFDASFHEIFCALLSGGELCLIDEDTRLDIPGLFRVVAENRIPTVFLPMSFLRIIFNDSHYVREFPRCVRHIQTAGEQVFINRLFRGFLQENHVYLHNHYGPSETHVVTTLTLDPDGDIPELPTIGKPILNSTIYILDREQQILPVGAPGEIYIGGIQVGRGYLFRPDLTAEKFIKNRSYRTNRTNIIYKTGDLARWLPNGNIEFLGRIDTQVKIRGFRIEPGEIESKLTDIEYIKEAVVIDRVDANAEKYLCAYVVSDADINLGELRGILSKTLPDYMIPSYFMRLEQIPLSPNGKVRRDALPIIDAAKMENAYIPPRDEVERKICRLWGEVLGMENDSIGIEDNFFELGGHSLRATILLAKMYKVFNVRIILGELFNEPTVKGLARLIKSSVGDTFKAIEPVEKKEYYPMSSAQKRMYIVNQLEKDSANYNMPTPMIIEGNVDKEKLAAVFRELIRRQEGLRTGFVVVGGEPVQKIEEMVEFEIEYDDVAAKVPAGQPKKAKDREEKQIIVNFVRPFDLSSAPLFRVGLAKLEEKKYLFMVDFHHIIGDGVSLGVMVREFTQLYEGRDIPPLQVQYHDYAVWQQGMAESGELKRQEEYWLNRLNADIPPLDLPLDYPRPAMASFEGRWVDFEIPAAAAAKLKKLAEHHDATLYMVVLAAYNVLLHKYTGQETIAVGSAIAGRSHPDLENIVGVFLNTLVMKNNPSDGLTFIQFLGEVRENALRAYENQDFQFEELVEKLNLKRDYSRNPIFDTMLNFINMDIPEIKLRDLKLSPYKMEHSAVKFDVKINAWEQDDMVRCTLDYCTKLFKPETMDTFIENFLKIIDQIGGDPGIKIAEISSISKEVEKEMIADFNEELTTEF